MEQKTASTFNSSFSSTIRPNLVSALTDLQALSAKSVNAGESVHPIASHADILHIYQENAQKSNDPALQFEFCSFLFDYAESLQHDHAVKKAYQFEAMEWLKKLASANSKDGVALRVQAEAQYRLAECFRLGLYVNCDQQQAWKLYESAAKKNHTNACFRAGICCEEGVGRKPSQTRALMFYRKSAGMIHFPSMFKLITIYAYQSDKFGIPIAMASFEALKWLKIVATHAFTNPTESNIYALAALYELGIWYAEGPPVSVKLTDFTLDYEYAIELIYESGRRGYSPAAFRLGEIFEKEMYGVKGDYKSAIFWYRRILSFAPQPDSDFVTLDEWKHSAQRKIVQIEQKMSRQQQPNSYPATTSSPPPSLAYHYEHQQRVEEMRKTLDDNSQRILTQMSQRKKLNRTSIPTPIRTHGLARPRPPQPAKQRLSTQSTQSKIPPTATSQNANTNNTINTTANTARKSNSLTSAANINRSVFMDTHPPAPLSMAKRQASLQPPPQKLPVALPRSSLRQLPTGKSMDAMFVDVPPPPVNIIAAKTQPPQQPRILSSSSLPPPPAALPMKTSRNGSNVTVMEMY